MEKSYRGIGYLFLAILVFVFVAFFPTYFGKFPGFDGTTASIHFHVAMVLTWFALLFLQPALIRMKKAELHRQIGKFTYFFIPVLIFSLFLMTRNEQVREKNLPIFAVNIFDVSMFVLYYTLAIVYRHKLSWHIRFMILTAVPFISPAAGRFQLPGFLIQIAIIAGLLIFERFKGKVYAPYLIALGSFIILFVSLGFLLLFRPAVLEALWAVFF